MFVQALLDQLVALCQEPTDGRIEDLFLDLGMEGELLRDLLDEEPSFCRRAPLPRRLEPPKEVVNRPVVVNQHGDRVRFAARLRPGHDALLSRVGARQLVSPVNAEGPLPGGIGPENGMRVPDR